MGLVDLVALGRLAKQHGQALLAQAGDGGPDAMGLPSGDLLKLGERSARLAADELGDGVDLGGLFGHIYLLKVQCARSGLLH